MGTTFRHVLLVVALGLSLVLFGGCSADEPASAPEEPAGSYATATTADVQAALESGGAVVIDARDTNAFNGWALDGVARGGHIEGAVDFSSAWLEVEGDDIADQLTAALEVKGIADADAVIVYDANGQDAPAVADYLSSAGIGDISLYDVSEWADDAALPMVSYPNYELIVPAAWVKDAIEGDGDVKVFEVSWGEESEEYLAAHIPGAVHIDTDEVEVGPMWNRVTDAELERFALANGITVDTPVILYGADSMPAYRVQAILTYMGVEDVRVLNGGFAAWERAGYETESGSVAKEPVESFGATVPARPDYIVDIEGAKAVLADPAGSSLVDIRSWEEHIGETPGYSDIDVAGRPAGARWGGDMPVYRNPDGTMRNFAEVLDVWAEWGITPEQDLSFFCGTGWRAAETLVYADVAGLERISLYDGGWYEWLLDPEANPAETGEPARP